MNFGLGAGTSGLSLMRILGSLSKTVGIVRQFAPIYKEVKPLLSKAPAFFQKLNSIRNTTSTMRDTGRELAMSFGNPAPVPTENTTSSNGPVFFQ